MTTTTVHCPNLKSTRNGFSLVEVMVAMTLLSLIISVGLTALTFISQSSASLTNYSVMSSQSRHALEEIARDIRMGYKVNSATTNKLDFNIYGKAGTTSNIVYEYSADEDKLFRTENSGTKEEMMDDLTTFKFNFYNLRKEATTAPISIKEVQVEGVMRKKALLRTNTNYIISARFMMRNRTVSN